MSVITVSPQAEAVKHLGIRAFMRNQHPSGKRHKQDKPEGETELEPGLKSPG